MLQRTLSRYVAMTLTVGIVTLLANSLHPATASAFTWSNYRWWSAQADFTMTANIINRGWAIQTWNAIGNWNSTGTFYFNYNASTGNYIDYAPYYPCGNEGSYAVARRYPDWTGFYLGAFNITINSGCGIPFYDGTQGPYVPFNYLDLNTVLKHELGHGLGLCHSGYPWYQATMASQIPFGVALIIQQDDLNGANFMYHGGSTPPDAYYCRP